MTMGSSPSKNKPGGRPPGGNRRPPAKKPPQNKGSKKTKDPPGYDDSNTYYTLEMKNGHKYDPRDAFLDEPLYPRSGPYRDGPARQPYLHNRSHIIDEPYVPIQQRRVLPQERPVRAMPQEQPWEPESIVPYTYAPQRPLRQIEAKEGHVTDDVIAVEEEPPVKSMSTQTEPVKSYPSRWLEERPVEERPPARNIHYGHPVPRRQPVQLLPYDGHPGDYRSQSQIIRVPRQRVYPTRHTSLSMYEAMRDRSKYNHTAVQSLIPHRREVIVRPNQTIVPQQKVILPQQVYATPAPRDVVHLPEVVEPPHEFIVTHRKDFLPPQVDANIRFYRNEIRFRPNGIFIDDIHRHWYGDYDRLENVHTYIQWLFPLPERSGTNPEAQPLKEHEIEIMIRDKYIARRILKSYMLMLDFYGIAMSNRQVGKLQRAENYKSRFLHLNNSSHNFNRIARITKSIGHLGLQHNQLPFVMFLLNEVLVTRLLSNVRDSNLEYWIEAIIDNREREAAMTFFIDHVTHRQKGGKGNTLQLTSYPESEDESIVFSSRRDFEDFDTEESARQFPKSSSAQKDELTEIPPLSLGLARGSS